MCKWDLHRGGEVEAMRTQWYGSGSEEELVERAGWRRVYNIGISPAVCGNGTSNRRHSIRAVITGKESIIRDTSDREQGTGQGERKGSGRGAETGAESERPEGAEIVGIRRKRGKKGDIIAVHNPTVTSNPYGGLSGNCYLLSIPTLAPEGPLTNDQVNYIVQCLKDIILNNHGGLGLNEGAPHQIQPILPPPIACRMPYSNSTACVTHLCHPMAVNLAER